MPLTITINEAAPGTLTIGVGTPGVGVPAGGTAGQVLTKVNSTDYNTVFATPSADYITAVTAPLSVTSGNLSVNLSTYLPLAGGTMNANATVDLSDTVTGTVSEVGGYGFAVSSASNINLKTNVLFDRVLVAGAVSATTIKPTGVEFPDLTLQTTAGISAATAASTYQTLAGMSSYLTTSAAASTYQTLAGMSSYLTTATAASTYFTIASAANKADLASPTFTGSPLSTTAAADTNTTQIATTAFVVGQASSTTPAATGTAAIGTSLKYARADHVHVNPLPSGGTTGQVLSKVDGTSYNVAWTTPSGGGYITSVSSPLSVTSNNLTVDLSTYLPLAGGTMTGYLYSNLGTGMDSVMTEGNFKVKDTGTPTSYGELNYNTLRIASAAGQMQIGPGGITFPDATTQTTAGYPNSNPLGFVDSAGVAANYYPLTNPSGFIGDAGYGALYARENGGWTAITIPPSPGYSSSVWTGSAYVSASVTNIYDTGSSQYYNVLTF